MLGKEPLLSHHDSLRYFHDGDIHLRLIRREPQIPYPLHTHDFYELVIVSSGSGIHFTDDAEYRVLPGDVFVIESGYPHGYRDTEDLHLYNLIFDQQLLQRMFLDIRQMPGYQAIFNIEPRYRETHGFSSRLRLGPEELNFATERLEHMTKELNSKAAGTGSRALALAGFIELVVYFSRRYTSGMQPDQHMIIRLADAFTFLEQNCDRQVSIEELLSITNMSHSSLNRAFHKAAGCSPIEYHLRLKIEKSCELLRSTGFSITMIADRCGFSDSNYYSRQFKRIMNRSPREYRSMISRGTPGSPGTS